MQKNCFLHFKPKYLALYEAKVFEISPKHSYNSLVQDLMFRCEILFFLKYFALCNRSGGFEYFLKIFFKNGHGPFVGVP